jgi:signal transduction histidine kinase
VVDKPTHADPTRPTGPHELWLDVLEQAVKLTAASSASLCLIDPEERVLDIAVAVGIEDDARQRCRLPIGVGVTGWVAEAGQTAVVPDVRHDDRYVAVRDNVRSELAVPLMAEGQVVGVINVDSDRVDAFPPETVELLEMLARRCADAIAYARLYDDARQKQAQLATVVDVGRELISTLDLTEVLQRTVRHARRLLDGKLASLLLQRQGQWETVATDGAGPAYLERRPLDIHSSLVGRVLHTGLPVRVEDVRAEPSFRLAEVAAREHLRGLLSVPLRSKDRIIGVLNVYTADRRRFRGHEATLLTLLAQQAAVAVENASLYQQAREAGERLRASEKLAALGRLSAGLAHELRNPLNTLNVLTYAMAEQASAAGYSTADLDVIQSEVRRLSLLVDQFLAFARPRAPAFRRQRIQEIVEETLLLIGPEARKRHVVVERAWNGDVPATWVDGDQIKQVLLNLTLNALQAMTGGGTLTVRVNAASGGVVTEIRDTGPGIPPEIRERLFEPFFTTRDGGTGLGLPIALRIVEAHSGDLRIESEPGAGTTVAVWLPL